MAYNPQMEQLNALQMLTKQISGQYGGGNDPKSVNAQNQAAVEGMRAQGMNDAQIAQALPSLPWNNQTRAIPAQPTSEQGLMADELGPAPTDAISGTIPAPAAPAPMPAPEQAAAPQGQPSFFQRLGQRFDQAATGGIIDPTTLTKDQRRILRGQLLMNLGGALSQNRPIGEGFQQQYNMISSRQADAEKRRKEQEAARIEAERNKILSGVDMTSSAGVMKTIPQLTQIGDIETAMKLADYTTKVFGDKVGYLSTNRGVFVYNKGADNLYNEDGTPNLNVGFIYPGTEPDKTMNEYQRQTIVLRGQEIQNKEQKAAEAEKKYRPLSSSIQKDTESMGTVRVDVLSAGNAFDDSYAGYKALGGSILDVAKIMPWNEDVKKAANWWTEYDRYKIVVRNNKFGATLTPSEKAAWDKVDITPDMDPSVIRQNLAVQQRILDGAIARRALTLISEGYNPESISTSTGLDFSGYDNPGYPNDQWNSWTQKERQQKQIEFWRAKSKPVAKSTSQSTPDKKYKVGESITINGKKYRVIPGGTDTDPNLQEVK